ncbi:MAG: hypothetical protein ACFFAO_16215, partial [Candidatus Hermodarchaeota archaeon]
MSYLERTIYWFLKNRVFGGIQKLKQKEYISFLVIIVLIISTNTVFAVLYHLNVYQSLEIIHTLLILEIFIAFAFIISGILVGRIKNHFLYVLCASLIIVVFILAFLFIEWSYDNPIFVYAKLFFFFTWIMISSISLFFLIMYFFTSFPKKVITLGMPKNHIFFGPLLKAVAYITIPLYVYMAFQSHPSSLIFGIFGVINALIVLNLMREAPKKVDSNPGIINYATAVGFFNMFMFYHIIMSFNYANENAFSLSLEVLVLFISVLYLVQVFTRRISETPNRPIPFESPVQFQSRLYVTHHLRNLFGEKGLVLIILGLGLGYHMVYLDSFFISDTFIANFPILSTYFNPNLRISDLYHRIYLVISFVIILFSWIVFKSSSRFKEFMVDKFTIKQVFRFISGYFTRPEEGESPFEMGVKLVKNKIDDSIKDWKNKWKNSIDKFLK